MEQKLYVVDCRYFDAVQAAFSGEGIFLPSVCCRELAEPISCHPDMTLCPVGEGVVVCAPSVFEAYSKTLSPFGIQLVQGEKSLGRDYPEDIAYNVLNTRHFSFARWESTEEKISRLLTERGVTRLRVAQGYSRCAALAVGDGIITADASIARAAGQAGLSVLQLQPGNIELPGYDYGFIGGASGILNEKTAAFFGSLDLHPEGAAIRRFVAEQGFTCREIPGQPLTDIGTILSLN